MAEVHLLRESEEYKQVLSWLPEYPRFSQEVIDEVARRYKIGQEQYLIEYDGKLTNKAWLTDNLLGAKEELIDFLFMMLIYTQRDRTIKAGLYEDLFITFNILYTELSTIMRKGKQELQQDLVPIKRL